MENPGNNASNRQRQRLCDRLWREGPRGNRKKGGKKESTRHDRDSESWGERRGKFTIVIDSVEGKRLVKNLGKTKSFRLKETFTFGARVNIIHIAINIEI